MREGSALISWFVRSTSSHHRPWQIAMAITAGVLLGILPKVSLLFVLVGLVCFVIPAHLPLLAMTALLSSCTTPLLESTLGRVGLWSLTQPQLATFWSRLDSLPLLPWLGIHNTVVNGSLMVWLMASVPVYLTCLILSKTVINESISDEAAQAQASNELFSLALAEDYVKEIRPLTGAREAGPVSPIAAPPLVIWDDIEYDQHAHETARFEFFFSDVAADCERTNDPEIASSGQVIRRAAEVAAWAEELITDELLMDDRAGPSDQAEPAAPVEQASPNDEEQWLIETTLEVVRIAERAVTNQAAMRSKQSGEPQDAARTDSFTQEYSEIQTSNAAQAALLTSQPNSNALQNSPTVMDHDVQFFDSNIRREQMPHTHQRSHMVNTRAGVAGASTGGAFNRPREEALHYLLRHLKDIQEKAHRQ